MALHTGLNRRIRSVGLTVALLAGLAAAPGAAQAQAWPAVLEAAKKEGSVMLYTQQVPPIIERIKADFTKAYPGITLETTRLTGTSIITKLDQERQGGMDGGDVVITVEILWLEERLKEGTLKKPVGPSLQAWPAKYLLRDAIPVLALEPLVAAYNTNLVKTPVNSYADLMRPELKGRLGTTEVQALSIVAWYEWLEKTQGADFLARLSALSPKIYTGAVPNAQSTASGEISATLFTVPTVVMPLIEKGAPMKMLLPKPALGIRYAGGIVGATKRPNASQVLVDYLMSPRGQAIWHSRGESASPLPNIPGSPDVNSIQPFETSGYNAGSVVEYKKRFDAAMKR
jgi:iron(III) transport system substrate-binding protein